MACIAQGPALETGRHTEAVGADCHWLTWLTLALSETQAGGFKERKWDTILPWRKAHLCDQRLDFGRAWCEVGGVDGQTEAGRVSQQRRESEVSATAKELEPPRSS